MGKLTEEQLAQIKSLTVTGKSTREIAAELGISKSTVARHSATAPGVELVISEAETEMSIDNGVARNFLADIGVAAPAPELKSMPAPTLKNNPKAIKLAERLMRKSVTLPLPQTQLQLEPQQQQQQLQQQQPVEESPANLIAQIHLNINHFEPVLKDIIGPDKAAFVDRLTKKSVSELSTLLKVIDRARMLGNITNQFKHMFWAGSSALEQGTKLIGLKTDGLTLSLRQQKDEVESILKELAMSRMDAWAGSQSPEMRLAYLVSATMLSVDTVNRMKLLKTAPTVNTAEEQEKVTAKFSDL